MKATGIVRKVDELGRFVLPAELRDKFGIKKDNSALEIYVDDDAIILKKYEPTCIFCEGLENVITYKNHNVCKNCINKLVTVKEALE